MFNHVTLVYISTPFVKETNNLYHEVVSNKNTPYYMCNRNVL